MSVMHQHDWFMLCPLCGGGGDDIDTPDWAEHRECELCRGSGVLDQTDARLELAPYTACPDCGARLHVDPDAGVGYCDPCGAIYPLPE